MNDGPPSSHVPLSPAHLARIHARIWHRYGFRLQLHQQRMLESSLCERMRAAGYTTREAYIHRLMTVPDELQEVIELLLNHETVFFRNVAHSHVLRTILLPALRTKPSVRLWSAGCATGEEAYSLAMTVAEVFGPLASRVHIFATDLSRAALHKAERGVYNGRTLNGITPAQRARWFVPCGDGLEVVPELRTMVTFIHHNLLDTPTDIPVVDIISCQNVLIYLHDEANRTVLRHLQSRMHAESMLLLGFSESLWHRDSTFMAQAIGGTFIHRLRSQQAPQQPIRPRRSASMESIEISVERARLHANREEFALAQQILRHVLSQNPDHRAALTLTGDIALRQESWADAIGVLVRAQHLDPADPLIAYRLAEAYRHLGQQLPALRAYQRALQLLRGHPPNTLFDGIASEWIETTCNHWLSQLQKGIRTGL